MARKKARRPVAVKSVKVEAVRHSHGQPATSVHVEVARHHLREEVGDDQVKRVLAEFPEREGETVRWTEEEIQRATCAPRQGEAEREVERYSGTHYGPSEPEYGVKVELETGAGRVAGQPPRESYAVREADEPTPSPSERIRHGPAPRRRR
jgi:hypothetical protein